MRASRFEINYCIDLLEREGYLVRRPSEVNFPVVLEVLPYAHWQEVGIRVDTIVNGERLALSRSFPADRVFDPDSADFRDRVLPRIMAADLAHYVADKLRSGIIEQVAAKVTPLVPKKRMSRAEIECFIEAALRDTRAEPKYNFAR